MNVRKRDKDSGGSGLTKNKLFGAIGNAQNPFSMNSRKAHDVETYRKYENAGELKVLIFEAEMSRIQASIVAQNLIAYFQRS